MQSKYKINPRYWYTVLFYLILPFLPLRLLWRSRKAARYRDRWLERFGYFVNKDSHKQPLTACIWLHAVSVGESLSAVPLIKELRKTYPTTPIVVTTMTPTGAECIHKACGDEIIHFYVPYDYPGAIKRFLRHTHPQILVIMETELWPNIIHYCSTNKIPVLLVNARLSDKSVVGYQKFASFTRNMLSQIDLILTQSQKDTDNYLKIGAIPQKVITAGNIKFDISISSSTIAQAKLLRQTWGNTRPTWIAASTHEGEEEKILAAHKKIISQLPNALLILVPRHPERFNKVAELCKQQNFATQRFSNLKIPTEENQSVTILSPNINILLGDIMGQLLLLYAASNVAFVGGSLVPWGGHNMLEPAILELPIITGPNLKNFRQISSYLLNGNAMLKVTNEDELAEVAIQLLTNSTLRSQYGMAAKKLVEQSKGVTQQILQEIRKFVPH